MSSLEQVRGIILFDTTSLALAAERALKAGGVSCAVIPTPVEFTAGCGISLLLREEDVPAAKRALEGLEGFRLVCPYEVRAR